MKKIFFFVFFSFLGYSQIPPLLGVNGQKVAITAVTTVNATTTSTGLIQLAGDLSGTAASPTVTNAAVLDRVLTGFTSASGTVGTSDTVLGALQKLDGNDDLKAPLASPTFTGVITGNGSGITSINASNISSGTLPIANGGTGITSVGTSGNVLTSNGTSWLSQSPTSTTVTYQTSSTTFPSTPKSGDILIVTSDGTRTGTIKEQWLRDSSGWMLIQGSYPVSGAIIDNTISNSASISTVGRYIVPTTGLLGSFIGHSNQYADWDGTTFTFTTPTDNSTVSIANGTNVGQVWRYTTAVGWAQVVAPSGQLVQANVTSSVTYYFNPNETKTITLTGTMFQPGMKLYNLPTGFTQGTAVVNSITSATITVTAPASPPLTVATGVTFGFSATSPHFPSTSLITIGSQDALTASALTTNLTAFTNATAGAAISVTSTEYTALKALSGASVSGVSDTYFNNGRAQGGYGVNTPMTLGGGYSYGANSFLFAFKIDSYNISDVEVWLANSNGVGATATKYTTAKNAPVGISYWVVKTPTISVATRYYALNNTVSNSIASSTVPGTQTKYYGSITGGATTATLNSTFLGNLAVFQTIVR